MHCIIRTEKEIVKYLEKDYDMKTIDETIEKLKKDNYLFIENFNKEVDYVDRIRVMDGTKVVKNFFLKNCSPSQSRQFLSNF